MTEPEMTDNRNGLEVAIIGVACRFPGASTIEEYWQNLRNGVESITFYTEEDMAAACVPDSLLNNPRFVKAYGSLKGIDQFDARFFGYSGREAEVIDPQQRLFLECAWEAMESAGYDSEKYSGSIGVYAGEGINTYAMKMNSDLEQGTALDLYSFALGNDKDFLATRVSYKLNLRGPSLTVQTACSTSLVAVHLAYQGLLSGECDIALAGGSTVGAGQVGGHFYYEGGIMSSDGHCRAFDAKAGGTVGGSGVGVVALKRLSDALADRDYIYAVIKGSAINNDGALKAGYTAPGIEGQTRVIRAAQMMAEVAPETIRYIEAHGTGTELGDPIEVAALTEAFRASTQKKGFCALGSVKTNIGHVDTAAGVAGLIKTVLALKHRMIPPSLHFEKPNPRIDFPSSPFYVPTTLMEWESDMTPRRAGVSSFGIGGTNAHVVLEEAPSIESLNLPRPSHLLLMSAKTETALESMSANLERHLRTHPDLNMADVAYTLKVGRKAFNYRRMLVCRDLAEAIEALESDSGKTRTACASESMDRPLVFMFPGQGTQYVNMGLGLYRTEPVFREEIDRGAERLRPRLGFDLRKLLYPAPDQVEYATDQIRQSFLTQPLLFVVEHAMARLWISWGLRPQAMIGHSIGEYVAACLAGTFSFEDALALVAARGQLMQQMPAGAMLAVPLSEADLQPALSPPLSLAAVNGPSLSVVSGPLDVVESLERRLAAQGVVCRRLHTSHAFHSEMMEPIQERFAEVVRQMKRQAPQIPYLSNVHGSWVRTEEATDPHYWARHLRQTVRFNDGLCELLKKPGGIFIEIGPGRTLTTLVKRHPSQTADHLAVASMPHHEETTPDVSVLLKALGSLWLAGVDLDWPRFYSHEQRSRLPLPTYPFERKRYWAIPSKAKQKSNDREPRQCQGWKYVAAENGNNASAATGDLDAARAIHSIHFPPPTLEPAPAAVGGTPGNDSPIECEIDQILTRQLQVMTQQLGLLRDE
jgi:acyl transferase domain-containing protein